MVYQQGQFIDQYTIMFNKSVGAAPSGASGATCGMEKREFEQAVVRVQFSPMLFNEIIRFEVDLNSVPVADKTNKDITVNWKIYDGFDPKGEFWTDSNGLEMQKRQIDSRDGYGFNTTYKDNRIPRNYYPIDSAIAMRDQNGTNIQVTIMNDRPQGGAADLSDKSTIEIM